MPQLPPFFSCFWAWRSKTVWPHLPFCSGAQRKKSGEMKTAWPHSPKLSTNPVCATAKFASCPRSAAWPLSMACTLPRPSRQLPTRASQSLVLMEWLYCRAITCHSTLARWEVVSWGLWKLQRQMSASGPQLNREPERAQPLLSPIPEGNPGPQA